MCILLLLAFPLLHIFTEYEKLKVIVNSYGIFAPLIFSLLVALQVFFAPIPGQVAGIMGGYLFGTFLGTFYGMIGILLGSIIAFLLSRKFGKPLVEKFIDKSTLKKFNRFIEKRGAFTLFLLYLIPLLPDDSFCYLAGLTKIKLKTFLLVSLFGRLPGFLILNAFGEGLTSFSGEIMWAIFIIFLVISFVVYFNLKKLEKFMFKLTHLKKN